MNAVDMTKGSPIKLLLQFSIPILIGNLFQQAYTLADRIIVGRFVGDTAFSAIGATNAMSMAFLSDAPTWYSNRSYRKAFRLPHFPPLSANHREC